MNFFVGRVILVKLRDTQQGTFVVEFSYERDSGGQATFRIETRGNTDHGMAC